MTDQQVVRHDNRVRAGQTVRLVVIVLIVAALVAVAIDNRDDVRIGYVFGDASAPVWIVLVAAGIGGVIIGWLMRHRSRD
jgi:uncharacterized integral membrane protein